MGRVQTKRFATRGTALGACLALFAASPAFAAERFASPTGTGATCTEMAPCSLKTAINPGVFPGLGNPADIVDGDTVTVLSGDYLITSFQHRFEIDRDITVRGEPGQPRPAITSDVSGFAPAPLFNVTAPGAVIEGLRITVSGPQAEALFVESGAAPTVIRDIYIEGVDHDSSGVLMTLEGGSTLERAELVRFNSTTVTDGGTLWAEGNVLVRDSFIRNTGTQTAIRTAAPSTAARFRNVTVGSGSGAFSGPTGPQQVSIRNSLIDGVPDLSVTGAGVEYSITHSNYNPGQVNETSGATVTETPPNQDQTASGFFPLLVDPLNGDFRQLAGSPTINAGSPDAFTGPLDIDGQPRTMGTAMDIGGDEFFESSAGPDGPPSNSFQLGKLTKNKKKGIAFVTITVPGPGEVALSGNGVQRIGGAGIARSSVAVTGGPVKLRIAAAKGKKGAKLRRKLRDKGKAKVKVRVTYLPTGGTASTRMRKLKLIRR